MAVEIVSSVGLGVGLAAACGFRVFLPVLVMGLAARTGFLDLTGGFEWMAGTPAPVDRRGGDGVRDRRLLHSVARQPAGHRRDAGGGDGRHGGSGGERRDLDTASELEPGRRDRRRGGGRRPDGNDPAARCFDCGHRRPRQPGGLDGRERGAIGLSLLALTVPVLALATVLVLVVVVVARIRQRAFKPRSLGS